MKARGFRDHQRELFAEHDEHGSACSCPMLIEAGRGFARQLIADGSITTGDMRGWSDALTVVAEVLAEGAKAIPSFMPMALQFGAAGVLLDDMSPDVS